MRSLNFLAAACAVLLLFFVAVQSDEDISLPKEVKSCRKSSNDYSSCLRLAIQESWPVFMKGIPELDLPTLDPYFISQEESTYENGAIKGKIVVKNARNYGLSKAQFLAVRPQLQNDYFRLEVDVEIPKVFIEGDYKAEGSLETFQMGGKGYFNISLEGVITTWNIEGPIVNDRWQVEHFTVLPEVNKMHVYFTDLFNGNENLNRAAMSFVNEYWSVLYHGMLPYVSKAWDEELTKLVNRMFSKISFSKTFP
ncbi:circadian clock-controlled protein [Cephus cinctus]|uniref:Circadian clock-controlled protein n=1 Tax=Cephus cinctus TaxID=211228 RepID=A0AAJ7C905_CEPCN|nr:circadian clock-controlled protein [Cephus cinctus]